MAHPREFAEGLSIGIIMDGNGRWAKNRGLPRTAGHKKGAEVFSDIADYCDELGVSSVYFYAFSTENWKRPLEEVNAIMRLFGEYLLKGFDYKNRNIRIKFMGDRTVLDEKLQQLMNKLEGESAVNLVMGIPHILLLILISFALGKGLKGVATGIILTHWTSLARLIRGEVLQLKESHFIKIAEKMGMSPWQIGVKHMMPHLLPQVLVGMVLMFPHAILHEASITFLGFGLSPEQPAIGVILSESMKYLTMGKWWLALFPGILLVLVVMLFHVIGDTLNSLLDPSRAHE